MGESRRCSRAKEESGREKGGRVRRGEAGGKGGSVEDATEARKSSLKLATRADGDAAKGDRVFTSKLVWRREYRGMGEGEVVFNRDGYANEAVNNDGFFLFPPQLCPFFFHAWRVRASREIVFHRVGGIIEKRAKREKDFYPRQL